MKAPYTDSAAESGKLFFDSPEGSMVCSATVVAGPGPPRQVQHGVDRGPLRARRQEGRLVPQHRLRAVVQQRRPVDGRVGEGAPGSGRPVRRLVGRLGARPRSSGSAGRLDRRPGRSVRLRGHPCHPGEGRQRQVAGGDGRFGAAGGVQRSGHAGDRQHDGDRVPGGGPVRRPEAVPVPGQAGPAVGDRETRRCTASAAP